MRCPFRANNGQPCQLKRQHRGPHDPFGPSRGAPADLDDASDDVMEYRERRDAEMRREENL